MSSTLLIALAGFIPGFYIGFLVKSRFPHLLADARPQVLVPMRRNEFRPPGVKAAARGHRDQWLWWSWRFIATAERVARARSVPDGQLPSLRTFEAWGMPRRTTRHYYVALARASIIEIRPQAGAYWLTRSRAARWSALAAQSFAAEADRPPRFRWQ